MGLAASELETDRVDTHPPFLVCLRFSSVSFRSFGVKTLECLSCAIFNSTGRRVGASEFSFAQLITMFDCSRHLIFNLASILDDVKWVRDSFDVIDHGSVWISALAMCFSYDFYTFFFFNFFPTTAAAAAGRVFPHSQSISLHSVAQIYMFFPLW